MTALAEFLERYDEQKPKADAKRVATGGDDALVETAQTLAPFLGRVAERGGFEIDDLGHVMWERMDLVVQIVIARSISTGGLQAEIWRALRDVAADAFMAGVLWEQERHLPRLEP